MLQITDFTSYGVLILYLLWEMRNKVLHSEFKPDLLYILDKQFSEHSKVTLEENQERISLECSKLLWQKCCVIHTGAAYKD